MGLLRQRDALGAAPQPLERIELTPFAAEDVDHEVEVVEQHPIGALESLDVRRPHLLLPERLLDGIGNRLDLPRVLPRADDEEIGEGVERPQVQDLEVDRLLVPGRLHNAFDGGRESVLSYTHLRAHETDSYLVCRLLLE